MLPVATDESIRHALRKRGKRGLNFEVREGNMHRDYRGRWPSVCRGGYPSTCWKRSEKDWSEPILPDREESQLPVKGA